MAYDRDGRGRRRPGETDQPAKTRRHQMSKQKSHSSNPISWLLCIRPGSQTEQMKPSNNLYDASPSSNSLPSSQHASSDRSPAHSQSRPPCKEPKAGTFSKVVAKPFKFFSRFLSRKVRRQTLPPNIVIEEAEDTSSITSAPIVVDERTEYEDSDGLSQTVPENPEPNMLEPRPPSSGNLDVIKAPLVPPGRSLCHGLLVSSQRKPAISTPTLVPLPNDGNCSVHSAPEVMNEAVETSNRGHPLSTVRSLSVDAPRWDQDGTHTWKMHPHCTTSVNKYELFDCWTVSTKADSTASSITSLRPLYAVREESPLITHKPVRIYVQVRVTPPWVRRNQISLGFTTNPYPVLEIPGYHPGSVAVNIADVRLYMGSTDNFIDLKTSFVMGDEVGIGMLFSSSTVNASVYSELWVTKNGVLLDTWPLTRESEGSGKSEITDLMGEKDIFATVGTVDEQYLEVKLDKQR